MVDLATNAINVSHVKTRKQQEEYVGKLKATDRPDFTKKTETTASIDSMTRRDFASEPSAAARKARLAKSGPRRTVVPKNCRLSVTNSKILEIYNELRRLQLSEESPLDCGFAPGLSGNLG